MGFDQPLTVALVDECELVHEGIATMLAGHARRVTVLPKHHHPSGPVDIALVDPFTRPGRDPDGPGTVRPAPGTAARVAVFTWEIRAGFVEFTRIGLLTTPITLIAAVLALWVGLRLIGV